MKIPKVIASSILNKLVKKTDKLSEDVSKINSDLGGFTPVVDETGKITGYKTNVGGADTVFPFRSVTPLYKYVFSYWGTGSNGSNFSGTCYNYATGETESYSFNYASTAKIIGELSFYYNNGNYSATLTNTSHQIVYETFKHWKHDSGNSAENVQCLPDKFTWRFPAGLSGTVYIFEKFTE